MVLLYFLSASFADTGLHICVQIIMDRGTEKSHDFFKYFFVSGDKIFISFAAIVVEGQKIGDI